MSCVASIIFLLASYCGRNALVISSRILTYTPTPYHGIMPSGYDARGCYFSAFPLTKYPLGHSERVHVERRMFSTFYICVHLNSKIVKSSCHVLIYPFLSFFVTNPLSISSIALSYGIATALPGFSTLLSMISRYSIFATTSTISGGM